MSKRKLVTSQPGPVLKTLIEAFKIFVQLKLEKKSMTTEELIDFLRDESYVTHVNDLTAVAVALKYWNEVGKLKVDFKVNVDNETITPVFTVVD